MKIKTHSRPSTDDEGKIIAEKVRIVTLHSELHAPKLWEDQKAGQMIEVTETESGLRLSIWRLFGENAPQCIDIDMSQGDQMTIREAYGPSKPYYTTEILPEKTGS